MSWFSDWLKKLLGQSGNDPVAKTFDVSKLAAEVETVVVGLNPVVDYVMQLTRVSPAQATQVDNLMKKIIQNADDVKGQTTKEGAQPYVQALITAVNALLVILTTLPLPPQFKTAVAVAQVALPIIEGLIA